jgi:hypothetical protein
VDGEQVQGLEGDRCDVWRCFDVDDLDSERVADSDLVATVSQGSI